MQLRSCAIHCVLVVAAACGGSAAPGSSGVGGACSATQACAPGLRCLTGAPGGLCVTECTVSGERDSCPSDGYCDRETFVVDGAATQWTVCLKSCSRDSDCRAEYRCGGASKGTGKVCRPSG